MSHHHHRKPGRPASDYERRDEPLASAPVFRRRLLQSGGGVPFRNSILNDEAVRKGVKMPPEWLDAVIGSAKISKLGLPVIVPVAEFRDIVGAALTATLSGADPATELKKAHEQLRPILERSEKA